MPRRFGFRNRQLKVVVCGASFSLALIAASAFAQVAPPGRLEINRKAGAPGHARSEFAVEWRPGALRATALQFDIECSPGWRAVVGPGQDATRSGKTVATSDMAGGRMRVVVFSVDALDLTDGELAAVIVVPEVEHPQPLWIEANGILVVDQSAVPVFLGRVKYGEDKDQALAAVKLAIEALEAVGPLYATGTCGLDVNGDGQVDVADLQALAAMAAADALVRCDLDGDGRLTKADFGVLSRAVLKHAAAAQPSNEISNSERK